MCLLLQTPPAEAHGLDSLAPPSLTGCELALPSAAQPGRRGGHHRRFTQGCRGLTFPPPVLLPHV